MKHKFLLAISVIAAIVALDVVTKRWAVDVLAHGSTIRGVAGLPLTLAYNTGIAFGVNVPPTGRWLLVGASVFVVMMLAGLFHQAKPQDWLRLSSVSLVAAGALGNLVDRVRHTQGVVDFIGPLDLGFMHWPIFNVADMAITVGAILLGISLWREETEPQKAAVVLESTESGSD
ncbi:MAG: signal peptidase II [Longimicrobiales bacterium]